MASNIASKIGFTNGKGGVTPHIRIIRVLARETSSSLSWTENVDVRTAYELEIDHTFSEPEQFRL